MQGTRQAAPGWRDIGFFAVALLIHSTLLLLPIKHWQTSKITNDRLVVSLQISPTSSNRDEPIEEIQASDSAPPRLHQKEPAADYTLAELPAPPDSVQAKDQPVSDTSPNLTLSAQQFRQWAEQADALAPAQQASRTLGNASPYTPPANWSRTAGAAFFASFDDRSHEVSLPSEVTIVDRWQSADGSHQVFVELPNGESLCGRAEAYNPMQPLVEPIMMFRSCGSSPTFAMPERFHKAR